MTLRRYTADSLAEWNTLVEESKNGTFLLNRHFMDYHSDRFADCSLMFYEGKKLMAVLPANYDEKSRTVFSHQGLTYGGLIMNRKISSKSALECFSLMLQWMNDELGAERFIYKAIPYIYNKYPDEEDLYALFRNNATLLSRGLSSCIDIQNRLPVTESRKSGLRKATDITVRETSDIDSFWQILDDVLTNCHNTHPVHSAAEIRLLMERFPECIKLFAAFDHEGKMLAGSWVFDLGDTIHTQYLCSSLEGKSSGALDKLIHSLITEHYSDRKYLDFGISTEEGGRILNEGLIFQKEGFGGRGICYDIWEVRIKN